MDSTYSSQQRPLRLIGVASGLGVPAQGSAGSARAAAALEMADVGFLVRRNLVDCRWDAVVAPGGEPPLARRTALRELCGHIAQRVGACIAGGALPVIVGGDHATAVGTWQGASCAGGARLGLLWIDAHLDAHTEVTSPSGNPHGMPLAALLGHGPNPWDAGGAAIDASRTCVFGVRSYEDAEMSLLRHLGVRVIGIEEIRRRGLARTLGEALAHVGGERFGLSIDLDAFDPAEAPGVNTPSAGGLDAAATGHALRGLALNPRLVAIEIAEYNPERDVDGRTAKLVAHLLESLTAPGAAECRAPEESCGAHKAAPLPVVLT